MNKEHIYSVITFIIVASIILIPASREFLKNQINGFMSALNPYSLEILPPNGKSVMPLSVLTVISNYGFRNDPITGETAFHSGIDLSASLGTPIYAIKDGNITIKDYSEKGYGYWVEIKHADNTYSRYAHLSEFGNISLDQEVGAGTVIGKVGNSGRSVGAHLHFEIRDNNLVPIDPSDYLGIKNLTPPHIS